MTDNKPGAPGADPDASLVPEADEIMQAGQSSQPEPPAELSAVEEGLRRELDETKQNLLRALAEAENVRRRASRDVSDARQYAVTSFARDLLSVSDNFRRALEVVEGQASEDLPESVRGLVDGVRMTERELTAVFERHGIRTIEPVGEKFDPNKHQAMFEIENAEVASGTVLQVMQPGSMIGERVLRPAMVGVSKGGPKPGAAPAEPAAADAPPSGDAPVEDGAGNGDRPPEGTAETAAGQGGAG